MKFDFTSILDRKGHDAMAVDSLGMMPGMTPDPPAEGFDFIPMWVADMNFPVVPTVQDAIIKRVQEPHFGYFLPRDEYFQKIIEWQEKRNGVDGLKPEHIGYENGVLGGVISALRAFANPGDSVLVHSPTYIGFTNAVNNAGYRLVHSLLIKDDQGLYRMDFADMEHKLASKNIHVAVFCSPHNPTGRVWEHEEIAKAMELYKKYDCVVISDEIWSDIILPPHRHIPVQSISEDAHMRTIALYAPSKTFNLAGLVGSYHIIYSSYLRDRQRSAASKAHYNEMNMLSMYALMGAYQPEGYEWVDELCEVIKGNVDWACACIDDHFEGVRVSKPQGTYMLFLDCEQWCKNHQREVEQLLKDGWRVGVGWQDGRPFRGESHIRMNLALPLSRVQEAFRRLDAYVFNGSLE